MGEGSSYWGSATLDPIYARRGMPEVDHMKQRDDIERRAALDVLCTFLFVIGCCIALAWIVITTMIFWNLVPECIAGDSTVEARGIIDCGDARRGAFFVSLFLAVLALPVASLLMVPFSLSRKWHPPADGRSVRAEQVGSRRLSMLQRAMIAVAVLLVVLVLAMFSSPRP